MPASLNSLSNCKKSSRSSLLARWPFHCSCSKIPSTISDADRSSVSSSIFSLFKDCTVFRFSSNSFKTAFVVKDARSVLFLRLKSSRICETKLFQTSVNKREASQNITYITPQQYSHTHHSIPLNKVDRWRRILQLDAYHA